MIWHLFFWRFEPKVKNFFRLSYLYVLPNYAVVTTSIYGKWCLFRTFVCHWMQTLMLVEAFYFILWYPYLRSMFQYIIRLCDIEQYRKLFFSIFWKWICMFSSSQYQSPMKNLFIWGTLCWYNSKIGWVVGWSS